MLTAFETAETVGFNSYSVDTLEVNESGHGRWEIRRFCVLVSEGLLKAPRWAGLKIIGEVAAERTDNGNTNLDIRYYIGLILPQPALFANAVRGKWGSTIAPAVCWM